MRRMRELVALKPKPIPLPRPDRSLYPFPTPVEKNTAYIAGKAAFDAEFREISKVYPERKITISVVAHSNSSRVTFNQECCDGSLVGGKKKGVYRKFKIVRLDVKHDIACWSPNPSREPPPASSFLDATAAAAAAAVSSIST